ncbi:MAG: hypothetical protein ACRC2V_10805, partial [Xenococcaceae cyanobacterium]
APVQHPLHQCNTRCTSATPVAPVQHPLHQCNTQPPKPVTSKDSKNPHTLTNYSDIFKTLSDEERESFEKFCEREIDKLPTRPGNPPAYIRKYWNELYASFQKEEARRKFVDEQIEASKQQATSEEPKTAARLNESWQIANRRKSVVAKKAIEEQAISLGYVVRFNEGIFDSSEDPSGGESSGGGGE